MINIQDELDYDFDFGRSLSPGERIERSEHTRVHHLIGMYFPGFYMKVRWWPKGWSMPSLLRPPYQLNIDPNALANRSELAAQIGIIAALWSRAEMWLGVILGDLLGTEPKFGLAMYFAIISTSARVDTIAAAAAERLDASTMLEFERLVKLIRARARERNRIVHSNWGVSTKHPNAIVVRCYR